MIIVAIAWGIGLAMHGFFTMAVPTLWGGSHKAARPELGSAPARRAPVADEGQRARSLEELSAAIAHEIRNPITAAKSLVQLIAEDPSAAETAEHARVAIEELDRVERSIAHLLRFAREEPFEPVELDVNELIESAIDLVQDRAVASACGSSANRAPAERVCGRQQLRRCSRTCSATRSSPREHKGADPFVRISAGQTSPATSCGSACATTVRHPAALTPRSFVRSTPPSGWHGPRPGARAQGPRAPRRKHRAGQPLGARR